MNHSTRLVALSLLLAAGTEAVGQNPLSLPRKDLSSLSDTIITQFNPAKGINQVAEYEPLNDFAGDCETALPYNATATGSLTLSPQHFKGGMKSLRWDYTPNDVMTFRFEEPISLKKPLYMTRGDEAAFLYFWIYSPKPIAQKDVYVKIYDETETLAFEFPLYVDFQGWRCVLVAYDEMQPNYTAKALTRMEFYAPEGEEGALFFDAISPTLACSKQFVNKDYLTPWRAEGMNHWGLQWKWDQLTVPTPEAHLSAKTQADLDTIYNRVVEEIFAPTLAQKWDASQMEKLRKRYASWEIKISPDSIITGKANLLDEPYFELMNNLADNFLLAPNSSSEKAELEQMYLNMAWNMIEQGFAKGHGMGYMLHYGYRCSTIAPAMFKMKPSLKASGLYKPMEEALIWLFGLNRIFDKKENLKKGNADDFSTLYRTYLELVQIIDDPSLRAVYMEALSNYFNYAIDWRNGGALKEHGAHYHHEVHYPNYASRGLVALGEIGVKLRGTRFRFSENAHSTLRNCAMAGLHSSYPCGNKSFWAIAFVGRHSEQSPIDGYDASLYENLALMGSPDGKEAIDSEMAAIYTTNFPNATSQPFGEVAPIPMDGTWTLPHGRNITHRRGNWSALVTSSSNSGTRNVETFGPSASRGANVSGILQAFGRFELYYHEATLLENGYVKDGFNWAHRNGITAPDIPVKNNRMKTRYYGLVESNYANGAVMEGIGGAYGTILDNNSNAKMCMFPGILNLRKSWFFLDDMIVALGSDINYTYAERRHALVDAGNMQEYPIVTTVFQKRIATPEKGGIYNGAPIPEGVDSLSINDRDYFIDPIGTGYVVFGKGKMALMNQTQESFAPDDPKMKTPLYAPYATLLINHGKECKGGSYEYCIVPAASEEQLQKVAKRKPYRIVQCDSVAHILEAKESNLRAHVIFAPYQGARRDLLQAVASGAVVVIRENSDKTVTLGVASPSFDNKTPIVVTLRGEWQVAENENLQSVEYVNRTTRLTLDPNEGVTTTLTLSPKR